MQLTRPQVVQAIAGYFGLPDDRLAMAESKLVALLRAGVPDDANVGTGIKAAYGPRSLGQLFVALHMIALGLDRGRAAQIVLDHWPAFAEGMHPRHRRPMLAIVRPALRADFGATTAPAVEILPPGLVFAGGEPFAGALVFNLYPLSLALRRALETSTGSSRYAVDEAFRAALSDAPRINGVNPFARMDGPTRAREDGAELSGGGNARKPA